jgi:hypothetical protein
MKSIIQAEKKCFLCEKTTGLEEHHIFFGTANRKLSEKHGLKVWLCPYHHRGRNSPHNSFVVNLTLKEIAQRKFEETHTREEFREIFGKSYL